MEQINDAVQWLFARRPGKRLLKMAVFEAVE
jgi:hypothetical protein